MTGIENRFAQDAVLAQSRRECDEATLRRFVDNETAELLPRVHGLMADVERLNGVLATAKLSGSDKEDAIRMSLVKLAELANP